MDKFCWDFKEFFESDMEFEKELGSFTMTVESLRDRIQDFTLYELLEKYYVLAFRCEKLVSYAELNSDLDMGEQKYINYKNMIYAKKSLVDEIKDLINEKILLVVDELDEYLKHNPELRKYQMHLYEVLRLKQHNVNDLNVRNLTTLIPKINGLYRTIQNVELKYGEVVINGEKVIINAKNYGKYLTNPSKVVRKKVFDTFTGSLERVNKSISGLLDIRLKLCFNIATLKGYNTVLEQVLSEDDLNMEIVDNLIKGVNDNLKLLSRYFSLKEQSQGLSKLNAYDLKLSTTFDKNLSFEEGVEIVKKSLLIMGDEYNEMLNSVLAGGCLDVYPKENKALGGYHWRNYTKPMILMNYNENFRDIYTITHELGHAVNGLMIKKNQGFQDFHFSVFLSEIASKVNENILDNYLINNADTDLEKKYILEQKLANYVDSVFSQTLFLELDRELYKIIEAGKSLNSDIINETFCTLYKKYYNDIEDNEQLKYLWQTRLHMFYEQYRYYNFQYATGLIIALKLSNDIINDKDNMLNKYLEFLTIGGSKPTLESLKLTGIDFSSMETFNDGMNYFSNLLDKYEEVLNKEKPVIKIKKG